jgi:hypothetical protein
VLYPLQQVVKKMYARVQHMQQRRCTEVQRR